ncbi:hypothetical protein [Corynebacterium bovis]|nr:hypothetical protein [Corynebacterium bovis]MDN8578304.1 hypothetical protein [Corynebacterium bovis]
MSRTGNAGENEWGSGVDDGGRTGRGFGRIVAAGFVAVVIVAAVALFIAGRFGGDDSTDASGDGAAGGAGGAVSSGQVAERFEWADRKADVNGQMVYKPEPRRGQILSDRVRSYPSASGPEASSSKPQGVIFESITMDTIAPIPFSTSDGPTGFDGDVPIGYSRSAAGAALAAGAYRAPNLFSDPSPEKARSVLAKTTTDQLSKFEAMQKEREQYIADEGESKLDGFLDGHLDAPDGYIINSYDGSYARVTIFDKALNPMPSGKTIGAAVVDLTWTDAGWKVKGFDPEPAELDAFPEGMLSWTS